MDVSSAGWLVMAIALVAANLPYVDGAVFGLIPFKRYKAVWLRLIELLVLYFLTGGLGLLLEGRIGSVFPQGWEFYVTAFFLFLVLGFPGFVWRYLRKRRT